MQNFENKTPNYHGSPGLKVTATFPEIEQDNTINETNKKLCNSEQKIDQEAYFTPQNLS